MDDHRRGFALIIVLVAVAAVFALAMQGAVAMRTATVEASALHRRAAAAQEARSAASIAVASLVSPSEHFTAAEAQRAMSAGAGGQEALEDDSDIPQMPEEMRKLLEGKLGENEDDEDDDAGGSADRPGPTRTRRATASETIRALGVPTAPLRIEVQGVVYEVRVLDIAGAMNINTAEERQLTGFFGALGCEPPLSVAIAQELLDWRDTDDFVRPYGAERPEHERRGVTIRNDRLQSVDELLYLPSMTREILERARPMLRVAGPGAVHAASAPVEVLRSVPSMTPEAADRIVLLRESGALNEETLDEALTGFARDASDHLTLRFGGGVVVEVRPAEGRGPAFRGVAAIPDGARIQWSSFGPI